MTEGRWHEQQKAHFNKKNTEIKICNFRADAIEDNFAFEFQDNHIMTSEEIKNKEKVYSENNLITVWLLNMNNRAIICDNELLVDKDFINDYIQDNSELIKSDDLNKRYVFYSYRNHIYYYNDLSKCINEDKYYNIIINKHKLPTKDDYNIILNDDNYTPELNYIQMGAGSGKTYSLVKTVLEENNRISILVSKTNIAKDAIYNKIPEILKENDNIIVNNNKGIIKNNKIIFEETDNKTNNSKKYYVVEYNNSTIIIATVDSFLYNFISNKSKEQLQNNINIFSYAAEHFNKETSKIKLVYKNKYIKGAHVYIDEAQDLHYGYKTFFEESAKLFNFNMTLIGDILQSIYYENNLYSYVIKDEKWKLLSNEKYICRRFRNPSLMKYVNNNIHNKTKNLSIIPIKQPIEEINNNINENIEVIEKTIEISYDNKIIEDKNEEIYDFLNKYVDKDDDPNKYAFIFPFIKNNNIATYVETILNEKFGSNNVKLFTSENGEPICLNNYQYHAKIISVHASKGESFDTVFVINVQPRTIASVYQKDNNTNSLLCWSMLNVAYTRAINKMYVLNFKESNELRFKWYTYNNVKHFISECINSEEQNELMNIFKKSLNYNEIINKKEDNNKNSVIDNNIQVLRYYIICSLLYLKAFKNANTSKQDGGCGSGEYYSKIFNIFNNQIIRCNISKEFKNKANEWNNPKYYNIQRKDMTLPIWEYKNFEISDKFIKQLYEDIKNTEGKPFNVYKLFDNYEQKIIHKEDEFILQNINKLYLLFVLMKLSDNPYITYDYKTLCDIINKTNMNDNDFKYLYESNKFIYETLPKFHFPGLTSKFKYNKLLSHQFLIYGKRDKNGRDILFDSENLDENEAEFDEIKKTENKDTENYIIDYPLNQPLNILNFAETCIRSLIEYVILINSNETNQQNKKIIRIYTLSTDTNKRLIDFDFRRTLTNDNIEKIKEIINGAVKRKNEILINDIINYISSGDLKDKLTSYINKYNDYENDDIVNTFKNVLDLINNDNFTDEQAINKIKRDLKNKLEQLLSHK